VFTRHLLDGLRGGARGAGGVIRIFDLYHYVHQHVVAEVGAQRPVFKSELMVFALNLTREAEVDAGTARLARQLRQPTAPGDES